MNFTHSQYTPTRRPTTKPTRRPVTTTNYGGQSEYDQTEETLNDNGGDDEDVGEEEESTAFFENGRIRKWNLENSEKTFSLIEN